MPSDLLSRRGRTLSAARLLVVLLAGAAVPGCSTRDARFSRTNARTHVEALAAVIGSRPTGTEANRLARDYLVGRLRSYGFTVRVQETDAVRREFGLTARVANVIAIRPGARDEAIALMAHYDSSPDGPGAADDAAGVAICLEAARVLAGTRAPGPATGATRPYTLAVILTDGEELGLMGAAAVLTDPVARRIRAVLNFEAIGSGGPVQLFQTGPGSRALIEAWADHAPAPAGASFMEAVYKAISGDHDRTDLGLFRRAGVPGLDFAFVGDSYTYHTLRDVPRRVDEDALVRAGENTIATVSALDGVDLSGAGGPPRTTYFDILHRVAVSYGGWGEVAVLGLALLVGLAGWLRAASKARREAGGAKLVLTFVWLIVGAALVLAAMVGAAWLLRVTSDDLHPWFAVPDGFFWLLVLAGVAAGRLFVHLGSLLPWRVRGSGRPSVTWTMTLPVWALLAALASHFARGAAFLVIWPLLAAGLILLLVPIGRPLGMRVASAAAACVAAVFWLPVVPLLLRFAVAELDRTPMVTPVFFYPVLLFVAGLVTVPPLLALIGRHREPGSPPLRWWPLAQLVLFAVVAFLGCWRASGATWGRPRHHAIRYVADLRSGTATWETAGNEPAPPGMVWQSGPSSSAAARVLGPMAPPFVHHASAPAATAAPFRLTALMMRGSAETTIEITAVPSSPGWTIAFALPSGVTPSDTNMPTATRHGRQTAAFAAVPPSGVTFRGRFAAGDADALSAMTVIAIGNGVPGAVSPHVPTWLPQEHDVWQARSYYLLPVDWQMR